MSRRRIAPRRQGRISRRSLARFCHAQASDERTLVIHSTDVDHRRLFPNSFVVDRAGGQPADLVTGAFFQELEQLSDASFRLILCTGVLEHLPEPAALVAQLHRILQPGGRLILSASAVFPFHGAPDNYFHFTPGGLRHLFRDWAGFERLAGSSGPFETIAVLLQRIRLQCDLVPPLGLLLELLARAIPLLDRLVLRQYANHYRRDAQSAIDSCMPAALHAVVIR
jgi:SAM-dependent methyltransferase